VLGRDKYVLGIDSVLKASGAVTSAFIKSGSWPPQSVRVEKIASIRPGIDIEVTREPVGVVALITPWNFPITIPPWKIAPALAYGNCVVFKPADLVPGSAHVLAEIISCSGLPGLPTQAERFRAGRLALVRHRTPDRPPACPASQGRHPIRAPHIGQGKPGIAPAATGSGRHSIGTWAVLRSILSK
jgi:hypothetical protein